MVNLVHNAYIRLRYWRVIKHLRRLKDIKAKEPVELIKRLKQTK